MTKAVFDKIAAGLEDAIAYVEGDKSRGREATVDVRAIRAANSMTQDVFAKTYRLPVASLRDWEQGRRKPDSGTAVLLRMIAVDPAGVEAIIAKVG